MISKLIQNKKLLTVVDQAVFSGTNFLVTIVLARLCTKLEFGKFSLVFMLMLFHDIWSWNCTYLEIVVMGLPLLPPGRPENNVVFVAE